MRIYDSIQGHLAQLVGRDLYTLSEKKKFCIERAVPQNERQVEWLIELSVGEKGNKQHIYLTDILRVYTWLVSEHWDKWAGITELESFISENCITKKHASYMMAVLATFDDIEKREGQGAAIKFMPKSAAFKKS
jgi:hypothetical protein